jgi:hypothetical protein
MQVAAIGPMAVRVEEYWPRAKSPYVHPKKIVAECLSARSAG